MKVTGAPETVLQLRGTPGYVLTQACPAPPVSAPLYSPFTSPLAHGVEADRWQVALWPLCASQAARVPQNLSSGCNFPSLII